MTRTLLKILGIFILGVGGGIFADQILWPYFIERPLFYQYRLEQNPIYVTERKEITIQENVALKNAIERVEKTVVGVKTKTREEILQGSGLILTSDGIVVTLADLVPQGADFSFFIDGQMVSFQILKRDLKENLALIKVGGSNLPTVGFANFEKIKLGERVFLVGVIFEKGEAKKTTNEGVIKYFDQDLVDTNIFETSTLAGSPLFNIEGEILGLNTVDFWGRVSAIPVTKIRTFAGF
ncbi:MAG: serine protease [Candidatus Paceibacterales bacterium]